MKEYTIEEIKELEDLDTLREIIFAQNEDLEAFEEVILELTDSTEEKELPTLEDVDDELFRARIIYIHDGISQDTLTYITAMIDYYNLQDKGIKKKKREPITIKIGTYGGEAYEALAIIDAIEASKTPIHVHVEGKSMSAGFFIWASGHTRSMGKRAVLMYHQLRGGVDGTYTEIKRSTEEWTRLQSSLDQIIIDNLNIPAEKLVKINENNIDWYIDYTKAKKMKMIK